jgi:hypothetical protein
MSANNKSELGTPPRMSEAKQTDGSPTGVHEEVVLHHKDTKQHEVEINSKPLQMTVHTDRKVIKVRSAKNEKSDSTTATDKSVDATVLTRQTEPTKEPTTSKEESVSTENTTTTDEAVVEKEPIVIETIVKKETTVTTEPALMEEKSMTTDKSIKEEQTAKAEAPPTKQESTTKETKIAPTTTVQQEKSTMQTDKSSVQTDKSSAQSDKPMMTEKSFATGMSSQPVTTITPEKHSQTERFATPDQPHSDKPAYLEQYLSVKSAPATLASSVTSNYSALTTATQMTLPTPATQPADTKAETKSKKTLRRRLRGEAKKALKTVKSGATGAVRTLKGKRGKHKRTNSSDSVSSSASSQSHTDDQSLHSTSSHGNQVDSKTVSPMPNNDTLATIKMIQVPLDQDGMANYATDAKAISQVQPTTTNNTHTITTTSKDSSLGTPPTTQAASNTKTVIFVDKKDNVDINLNDLGVPTKQSQRVLELSPMLGKSADVVVVALCRFL